MPNNPLVDTVALDLVLLAALDLGLLAAAILLGVIAAVLSAAAWWNLRRIGFTMKNFYLVRQWHANGCPAWKLDDDGVFRMHPTRKTRDIDDAA